jgi:hypothetical protein
MMKAKLLFIFFILLILSCGRNEKKPVSPDKQIVDSNYYRLEGWLNYYGLEMKDFTDSLPAEESDIYTYDYDITADSNNFLKEFIIYSPDSTNCLDLYSYSLGVFKDSLGQLVFSGSEVDSEVALIDFKNKKKIRIWFCGTMCLAEEAQWIRNDFIYILGFTRNDNDKEYPTIWTFEISNHFAQTIMTKFPVDLSQKSYLREVALKKIKFR